MFPCKNFRESRGLLARATCEVPDLSGPHRCGDGNDTIPAESGAGTWWKAAARCPGLQRASAKTSGVVSSINTRALGLVLLRLGGGRQKPEDDVDPVVGLDQFLRVGEEVDCGSLLCRIHARDEDQAASVLTDVQRAFAVSDHPPKIPPVVVSVLEST